jgi:hypothetical protein
MRKFYKLRAEDRAKSIAELKARRDRERYEAAMKAKREHERKFGPFGPRVTNA